MCTCKYPDVACLCLPPSLAPPQCLSEEDRSNHTKSPEKTPNPRRDSEKTGYRPRPTVWGLPDVPRKRHAQVGRSNWPRFLSP